MAKYKNFIGLGIAGNFALHLDQAGEAEDFKEIMTAEEAAPKGMFPFFLPKVRNPVNKAELHAKEILSIYPLGADNIKLPKDDVKVQAEPEVALVCDLEYTMGRLTNIVPKYFGAYNDCSIRTDNAKKISEKKNWGHGCKGLSNTLFPVKGFLEKSNMDHYSICSFLKRDGDIHAYGEDVEISGYSYFHEKLIDWMTNQINTQENFGPLEPIFEYIQACDYPTKAIISIGATRYTQYGEKTYLQEGDEMIVIVYDTNNISSNEVFEAVKSSNYDHNNMSVLAQKITHHE